MADTRDPLRRANDAVYASMVCDQEADRAGTPPLSKLVLEAAGIILRAVGSQEHRRHETLHPQWEQLPGV